MKKALLSIMLLMTFSFIGKACDIKFNISGDSKPIYKAGEEVIVEVTVTYTHRVCQLELSDTKFNADGVKILGATQWKEKAPGTYTRQLKVLVLQDGKKEGVINVVRECAKEGGYGTFKIRKE